MAEKKRPPVRINLGNKEIKRILHSLRGFGWKLNDKVLSLPVNDPMHLDVDRSTYSGDLSVGSFFHFIGDEKMADHSDTFEFKGSKLKRICPKLKKSQVIASI